MGYIEIWTLAKLLLVCYLGSSVRYNNPKPIPNPNTTSIHNINTNPHLNPRHNPNVNLATPTSLQWASLKIFMRLSEILNVSTGHTEDNIVAKNV